MSTLPSSVYRQRSLPRKMMLAFMLTTLLAPATILNKLLFVALLAWTLALMTRVRSPRPQWVWPSFGIIGIFLYGYLLALPFPNDHDLALQFFLATFVLLLIHFVEYFNIDMDQAVEFCGKIMVGVTAIYWLLALNPELPYAQELVIWFQVVSQSATAERDYLEEVPVLTLALGTAPFFFVPWCLVVMRILRRFSVSDLVWLILYGAAIALSGARGVVVVALLFLAFAGLVQASIVTRVLLMVMLCAFATIILPTLFSNTVLFSRDEISNAAKIGHFQSFWDQLGWFNSIFGGGLGSFYFTVGKGAFTQHTELTPIDLARYVGIPFAISVYCLMLLPRLFRSPFKGQRPLVFTIFVLYLLLSVTNPVLINSFGMLVVVWYWAKYRQYFNAVPLMAVLRFPAVRSNTVVLQSKGESS